MESCRSESERRHRAASASDTSKAFDQRSKSRTSSSSSQETAPGSSGKGTRVPSGHGTSPSSSRRNTVTSTLQKRQTSPSLEYDQRTDRSLTESLSSPGSSSHRTPGNISTAQAISLAASTACSPMFHQTSTHPDSGPHSTSSTVINVPGEQRKLSSNSVKDCQPKNSSDFFEEDTSTLKLGPTNNTLVGNTHIIKVSGPVTNLDETVLSAVGMEGGLMASSISENSTTSTASASSSMAPVVENREVFSSPFTSSLASSLAYDCGYVTSDCGHECTSRDLQSLKSSVLEHSTNTCTYEAAKYSNTLSESSISEANVPFSNRSRSQGTISESKSFLPSALSLSTSDLSERLNKKAVNNPTTSSILKTPTSPPPRESPPSLKSKNTSAPHTSL